jgi:hypothetical protein
MFRSSGWRIDQEKGRLSGALIERLGAAALPVVFPPDSQPLDGRLPKNGLRSMTAHPYAPAALIGEGESMKISTLALLVLAVASTSACKKKEAAPEPPAPAAEKAPAPEPEAAEPAEPAGPAIPEVALTGSASENLVAVFEAGVNALKGADDAATGAAILTGMLEKYDVADLRAKSKAAKAAGEGASDATKAKFKSLKAEYAEVSTKLGASDPKAFGEAAKAWAAAWGLN